MAIINGTSGDDILAGTGNGIVDTIDGGGGNDTIQSVDAPTSDTAAWEADAAPEGAGDILNGGAGDDTIIGSAGAVISGGDGDDSIDGLFGSRLSGDAGNDTIGGFIAVYAGNLADYEITRSLTYIGDAQWAAVYEVKDLRFGSPDGNDIVFSNSMEFADGIYMPAAAPDSDTLFLDPTHNEFYIAETPADVAVPGTPTDVLDVHSLLAFGTLVQGFSIAGGADAAAFTIDATTGMLSFVTPPDYEAPTDQAAITRVAGLQTSAAADNVYEIVLRVVDPNGIEDLVGLLVHVDDFAGAFSAAVDGETVIGSLENDAMDDADLLGITLQGLDGDDDLTLYGANRAEGGAGIDNVTLVRDEAFSLALVQTGTVVAATDGSTMLDIETLNLTGSAQGDVVDGSLVTTVALTLNGNEGDDILLAGGAGDTLIGGIGSDILIGGAGNDALYAAFVPQDGAPNEPAIGEFDILFGGDGDDLMVGDGGNTWISYRGPRANYTLSQDPVTGVVTVVDNVGTEGTDTVHGFYRLVFADMSLDAQLNPVTTTNVAPQIDSDGGLDIAALAVGENSTAVTIVHATDPNGDPIVYEITGGADAALFQIDAATGVLSFRAAPDAEAPTDADADGTYDVVVRAQDGRLADVQALAIHVTDVNEFDVSQPTDGNTSPVQWFGGTSVVTGRDGSSAANLAGPASGQYGQIGGVGVTGGAMAVSADVRFDTTGNWERVFDLGQAFSTGIGNVYVGRLAGTNDLTFTIEKNGVYTYRATAVGAITNGQWLNFTASVDASGLMKLYVNGALKATTQGVLPETGARDFFYVGKSGWAADATLDGAVDNLVVLQGSVTAAQAAALYTSGYASQAATLPPGILYDLGASADAGWHHVVGSAAAGTAVNLTVSASDADATTNAVTYSIPGFDAGSPFAIDAATGMVSVNNPAAIDYTALTSYVLTVVATSADGSTAAQDFTIVIDRPANLPPVIDSNGGAASAALTVNENTTQVTTVHAVDPDGKPVTYSIVGGADAAKFSINATSGLLTFKAAPNAEVPADAGADGTYDVIVQAGDGTLTDTQTLAITVADVNEFGVGAPVDLDTAANTVQENLAAGTAVGIQVQATDGDATRNAVTYSLSVNPGNLFAIDAVTGVVTTAAALDYEAGASQNIQVKATSADGSVSYKSFTVAVGNVNETPTITSSGGGDAAAVSVNENTSIAVDMSASDPDIGQVLKYSIVGGADAAKFTIDMYSGLLFFKTLPNAEAPADTGADGTYDVVVQVSDGTLTDTQALAITVADVNEFGVSVPVDLNAAANAVQENLAAGTAVGIQVKATDGDATRNAVTYALSYNPGNLFAIDAVTGVVTTAAALNYEAGAFQTIQVKATSADGSVCYQSFSIAVGNVNEAPVFTSPAAASVAENSLAVLTVAATDPDVGQTRAFSIAGGADAAAFVINASTGALAFAGSAGPDFERPTDADANNVYDVQIQVTDSGGASSLQTLAVSVTNIASLNLVGSNAILNILRGGGDDDVLTANGTTDYLYGNGGNDTLIGNGGLYDLLDGGAGIDTASYATARAAVSANLTLGYGTAGDALYDYYTSIENLTGSAFNDTLIGNGLANALNGGAGHDTLTGGGGADTLTGGAGNDVFKFLASADSAPAAPDRITDFLVGNDVIDLSAIDAKTTVAGDQAFSFIGAGAFTGQAGQLRAEVVQGNTTLYGDTNGDGKADFALVLDKVNQLLAANMVL